MENLYEKLKEIFNYTKKDFEFCNKDEDKDRLWIMCLDFSFFYLGKIVVMEKEKIIFEHFCITVNSNDTYKLECRNEIFKNNFLFETLFSKHNFNLSGSKTGESIFALQEKLKNIFYNNTKDVDEYNNNVFNPEEFIEIKFHKESFANNIYIISFFCSIPYQCCDINDVIEFNERPMSWMHESQTIKDCISSGVDSVILLLK